MSDIFEKIPMKQFAECPNYPGWSACDDGSVWHNGNAMTYFVKTSGYVQVTVGENGKPKNYYVHHIVADAFLGSMPSFLQVDHINGNKQDNRATNLRYVTCSQNVTDRPESKKQTPCRQEVIDGEIFVPMTHNVMLTGYSVSNKGRVRTPMNRVTIGAKKNDHLELHVNKNGANYHEAMHRLVARYFLNDDSCLLQPTDVLHLDDNKFNNCADNLVLVNPGEKAQMTKLIKKELEAVAVAKRQKTSSSSSSSSESEKSE